MTKFEEDLNNKINLKEVPMHFTQSGCSLTRKTYIETNWVFDTYGNWHSDEEFQELKEEYSNQADSILLMLEEIGSLKSQLQQQALPVVPECVAEWIEHCKGMGYGLIAALTFKLSSTMHEELSAKILKWLGNEGNDETFALAFITGKYQVEKPQLFYLKNKLTGYYLFRAFGGKYGEENDRYGIDGFGEDFHFTQQEIDSMQTGSYEQIEVEK